jgi:hypothetical protein
MRILLLVPAIGLVAALLGSPPAASQEALGGADLLQNDLRDWTRAATGKTPWRLTADRTLACAAAHDAVVSDTEFGDGTLKFEYRFRPTDEPTGYKAALVVRRTRSSGGCKVALGDDCGTITATYQGSSDRPREFAAKPPESPARPAGHWNYASVRLKGRSVVVTVNRREVGAFDQCDGPRGLVSFEVEGSEVEFRRVYWYEAR